MRYLDELERKSKMIRQNKQEEEKKNTSKKTSSESTKTTYAPLANLEEEARRRRTEIKTTGQKNQYEEISVGDSYANKLAGVTRNALQKAKNREYAQTERPSLREQLDTMQKDVTLAVQKNNARREEEKALTERKKELEKTLDGQTRRLRVMDDERTKKVLLDKFGTEEYERNRNETAQQVVDLEKELESVNLSLEDYKYDEYKNEVNPDNFFGEFESNYELNDLQLKSNFAWNDYIKDPTEQKKRHAQAIDEAIEAYTRNNQDALDGNNWISKSAAGYLPQLLGQTGAGLKNATGGAGAGAATGAGIALAAGNLSPLVAVPEELVSVPSMAVGGAIKGGKAGYVAGVGKYSYDMMKGAAYKGLLDEGYDNETALAAANDEAFINGLIEAAGAGVDIATLGFGTLLKKTGSAALKKLGVEATKKVVKQGALKTAGKAALGYGLNVASEAGEEALQELVSIANENRLKSGEDTGKLNLIGQTWDQAQNLTDEEKARVQESATEGAKIAAMFGGATAVGTSVANTALDNYNNNRIGKTLNADDSVQGLIESGLESDKNTDSYKLATQLQAKVESGQQISNTEIGKLAVANEKAIRAENDAQNQVQSEVSREANAVLPSETKTAQNANTNVTQGMTPQTRFNRTLTSYSQAVKGLGDNGAKALRKYYNGNQDFNEFYNGFSRYYEAGLSNVPRENINTAYAKNIEPTVREIAYLAGQNDREVSLQKDIAESKYATVYGKESGFIKNDYSNDMTQEDIDFYNSFAKAIGKKITFVDAFYQNGEKVTANGSYNNGVVSIAKNAADPMYVVASHEVTHAFQKSAPKEYRAYRDYVMSIVSNREGVSEVSLIESYKQLYARNNMNITTEKVMDEIAADFTKDIFKSEEQLRKFVNDNITSKNRTMVEKFFDAVREFINKVRNVFKGNEQEMDKAALSEFGATVEQLEHAEKLWKEALQATMKKTKEASKQADSKANAKADNTQYSLKDSEGRTLTEAQAEFFKDSKVRDGNGNLLVMYHGTPNGTYTVFKSGTYFTANKEYADKYQNQGASSLSYKKTADKPSTYEVYLNIKKPFDTRNPEERAIFENEYYRQWGTGTPLMESGLPDWTDGMDLQEFIEEMGYDYDGLILDEGAIGGYGDEVQSRGISYVVFSPEQVKSVDNLNPTDNEDIRFSLKKPVEETKDLIAVHNLDADNLNKSLDLGGFPVPSIAITKAENEYGDFGDITLVFSKDTIDPDNPENEVYTRDVYSKTIPRVKQKITPAKLKKLQAEFEPYFEELGGTIRSLDDNTFTNTNVDELTDVLAYKPEIKLAYLRSKGEEFELVYSPKKWQSGVSEDILQEFADRHPEIVSKYKNVYEMESSELWKYEAELQELYMQNSLKGKTNPKIIEMIKKSPKQIGLGTLHNFISDVITYKNGTYKSTELDIYGTRDKLKELVGNNDSEFRDWIREQVSPYYGEKYHDADGKKIAPTLSALTEYMKQGATRAKEKTLVYNMGKAVAESSKKLNSIKSIKEYSDNIKDSATVRESKAAIEKLDETVRGDVARNRITRGENFFDVFEDYYKALAQYMKNGKGLEAAFKKNGFSELTGKQITELKYLAEQIQATPVSYFEAKPQRAVEFDEVLAAVIPKDTDANLKARLQEKGVNVIEYDSKVEGDRLRAVNSVEEAKFSLKGQSDLLKENARLTEYNEYLKEQMKVPQTEKQSMKELEKLTEDLIKEYNASASIEVEDLLPKMKGLYDLIVSDVDENGNKLTWETLKPKANEIATYIVERATATNDELYQEYAGLRDYLRNTKIKVSPELKESITDYNDFRKANFGRMKLSNEGMGVDVVYQELSNMYPEFFDSEDIITQVDQLYHIEEVLDSLQPFEFNPYEYDVADTADWLSNNIIERFYNAKEAKPAAQWLKDYARQKVKSSVAKQREQKYKAVAKTKEHYLKKEARMSERKKKNVTIKKIRKHYDKLYKMVFGGANVKDESRMPSFYRSEVAEFLMEFNFVTNRSRMKGVLEDYQHREFLDGVINERSADGFDKLLELYKESNLGKEGFFFDAKLEEDIKQAKKAVQGIDRLSDLNSEDLENIYRIILGVRKSIENYKSAVVKGKKITIAKLSENVHNQLKQEKGKNTWWNTVAKADELLNIDMLTPVTFFEMLGGENGVMSELYGDIREGFNKAVPNIAKTSEFMQDTLKGIKVNDWYDKKQLRYYRLESGEGIAFSPIQVMSLYVLEQRPSAKNHIYGHGIKPSTTNQLYAYEYDKNGKEIGKVRLLADPPAVVVTEGDIKSITSTLTKEQKAIADKMQKFLATFGGELGNEVAMEMFGYLKYGEPTYFPMVTDGKYRDIVENNMSLEKMIYNASFTKPLMKEANNPLIIEDIFDVFTRHMSDMITYNAFSIPLQNLQKVVNFKRNTNEFGEGFVVQADISKVAGEKALGYIKNLLGDISGGIKGEIGTGFSKALLRNSKKATLGISLSVLAQQFASVPKAMAYINPIDIARAYGVDLLAGGRIARTAENIRKLTNKEVQTKWDKVKKYSPLAQWKDWGYFTLDVGPSLKQLFTGQNSFSDKLSEYTMATYGMADKYTLTRIWEALEYETKRTRKDLKPGTDEFNKAVAERFDYVVERTQVVDSTLTRSQIMREDTLGAKFLTNYMSEPTQAYNLFRSALYRFNHDKDFSKFARTSLALVSSFAMAGFAKGLVDMLRGNADDGEDDETWLDKYIKQSLNNTIDNFIVIPYVREVWSAIQGFASSRPDTKGIENFVNSVKKFFTAYTAWQTEGEEPKLTMATYISDILAGLGQVTGIPVGNLVREFKSFTNGVIEGTDSYEAKYAMAKVWNNIKSTKSRSVFTEILYEAAKAEDLEAYNAIFDDMAKNGVERDKIISSLVSKAKKDDPQWLNSDFARKIGLKGYIPPKTDTAPGTENYSINFMTDSQYDRFTNTRANRLNDLEYDLQKMNLDEETYNDLWQAAYDYAETTSMLDVSGGKVVEIGEEDYLQVGTKRYDFDYPAWMEAARTSEEDLGLSLAEYLLLKDEYSYSALASNGAQEAYDNGIDVELYLMANKFKSEATADPATDDYGNILYNKDGSVKKESGSKKRKVSEYIQELGISEYEYYYLMEALGYKVD